MPDPARVFAPGGEWAYFKWYCGEFTAERLLADLDRLTGPLERDGIVTHWFFVRYVDPWPHLRVRFRLADSRHWPAIVERVGAFLDPVLRDERVWKVQIDTYHREIERYGGTIECSERLFHRDSRLVLDALRLVRDTGDEPLRWQLGLAALARMLDGFACAGPRGVRLLDRLAMALLHEHGGARDLRKALDRRFREQRTAIERAMRDPVDDGPMSAWRAALDAWTGDSAIDRSALLAADASIEATVSSHLHMFCNRLFPSRPRDHEMVLYWFLAKHLRGQALREAVR